MCECEIGIEAVKVVVDVVNLWNNWGKHDKPKTVVHEHYHSPKTNSYTRAERSEPKKYETPSSYHRPKYTPSYRDFEDAIASRPF